MKIEVDAAELSFLAAATCLAKSCLVGDVAGSLQDLTVLRAGVALAIYDGETMTQLAGKFARALEELRAQVEAPDNTVPFPLPMGATPRDDSRN